MKNKNLFEEYEAKAIKMTCKKCKTRFCYGRIMEKCPFCGHTELEVELPNVKNGLGGNLAIKKETVMG